MGLINKVVKVHIGVKNYKHYESLGYEIPRKIDSRGRLCIIKSATIDVKVEDLADTAVVNVDVACDCCNKLRNISYSKYKQRLRDGKSYCYECATKLFNTGKNSANWNPNLTDEERKIGRCYPEYYKFVNNVLERDNYKCQVCGVSNNHLHVHHKNAYKWDINGRCDVDNGITLCDKCHKAFHKKYEKGNNTEEQFNEWFALTYDEKIFNTELPIKEKKEPKDFTVYNATDNIIYQTPKECANELNVTENVIRQCCASKVKKHIIYEIKGKCLFYLSDYNSMDNELREKIIKHKEQSGKRKVICLTTSEIFNSISEAAQKYNIYTTSIIANCKRVPKHKSAGKLPDKTPLRWMYYDEYLKLCSV